MKGSEISLNLLKLPYATTFSSKLKNEYCVELETSGMVKVWPVKYLAKSELRVLGNQGRCLDVAIKG